MARELVRLPTGALVIDTPGMRELQLLGGTEALDATFAEIAALASGCAFRDCRHGGEPGCAVATAVREGRLSAERLASHHKLAAELAHQARRHDAGARAEERRRWRSIHKSLRSFDKRRSGG
jgi:ribosome biogenesis GTPase